MLIEAKEQSKNNSLSSDSRYWFSLKNKIVKLPGKKLFFFEHTLLIGHFTEQQPKKWKTEERILLPQSTKRDAHVIEGSQQVYFTVWVN